MGPGRARRRRQVPGASAGSITGRLSRWEALAVGAGINARGVIQIVLAVVGVRLGLLTAVMYSLLVLIALVARVIVDGRVIPQGKRHAIPQVFGRQWPMGARAVGRARIGAASWHAALPV
ncbi:hypothetical protein AB0C81_28880 [Streptomyces roseoverticillatus]|uniref:hypothetical protein n=1 Tax=Streptomyces roseoverticillatus TaxID=66429 RepID=UPI0033D3CFF8